MRKSINFKVLSCALFFTFFILFTNVGFAVDSEILQTGENYLIYIFGVEDVFEYYTQPAGSSDIEEPTLYTSISSLDSAEANANNIAVLNVASIGNVDSLDLWYRYKGKSGEKVELDFTKAVTQEDLDVVKSLTNVIDIEIDEPIVNTQIISGESTEVTIGAFKIINPDLDNYTYKYYISKVQSEDEIALRKLAEESASIDSMYEALTYARNLKSLAGKVAANLDYTQFIETVDGRIVQPQESKDKEEVIIWLAREKDGNVDEMDMQFVTCTRIEKGQKVIVPVVLPTTYDNIALIVILVVSVAALVFVVIRKNKLKGNK